MKRQFFSLYAGVVGCALALQFPATAIAKNKETILYSFAGPPDGAFPYAGLIDVKGTLYGTTEEGGTSCCYGTVFSVNPKTGAEKVVYFFCSKQNCTDGEYTQAGLIDVKGTLYGTTELGGSASCGGGYGCGTVFSVSPTTGAEAVVHSFLAGTDGEYPYASVIDVKGMLYGTTDEGGAYGDGTVFSVNPTTGAEKVLHSFDNNGTDGLNPVAGLLNVKGTLYGTTESGGAHGYDGTVFSVNPTTGAETVVYSFTGGTDGRFPFARLIDVKGALYGTTFEGGANYCQGTGCGTVFSVNPETGTETVLHSFAGGNDGANPDAGLIDVKGTLYGTTALGGSTSCRGGNGCGTVFSVNPSTGAETVLYSFGSGKDGANPNAGLIDVKGTLYGTTEDGGTHKVGAVFALKKP